MGPEAGPSIVLTLGPCAWLAHGDVRYGDKRSALTVSWAMSDPRKSLILVRLAWLRRAEKLINMLMYQSPSLSGFKLGAQYSFNTGLTTGKQALNGGGSTDVSTGGSAFETGNNMRNMAGAVSYTNSGFYVTGVYDKFTPASNTLAGANGGGVTSWVVAAAYREARR